MIDLQKETEEMDKAWDKYEQSREERDYGMYVMWRLRVRVMYGVKAWAYTARIVGVYVRYTLMRVLAYMLGGDW